MVKLWAEKEMRNLLRIRTAELNCPKPLLLRNHVLVMGFLGDDSIPAPKLKDARLTNDQMRETYLEMRQNDANPISQMQTRSRRS
jgi:RIO kinase 1